ncbi:hypothetical protein M408DRAFT_26245 [Serendipita vermifera MAFF 305830]|uniref:Uncharacterized protein n=1 Tax=Serendipita vermifera MAFF 305830 TaxID=933852 RepID=A0A0C2WGD1_SERVB|nr:hypothetical protein M408DRAFT_26245 [Serendipita vermifera MAFF 305830]
MSSLNCQQCKQPVQIDESLSDLTPSTYELIAGSIPRASGPKYGTTQDLLSKTPAHPSVKAAWERSQANNDTARRRSAGTASARHRASVAGGESFVLLQDSIVRNIPASPPNGGYSTSKGKGKASAKEPASATQQQAPTVNPTPLSHHLRSVNRLYALLSAKTEVDHPLCDECTHLLLGILNKQLEETTKERDGYIAFEKQIKKEKEREGDKANLVDAERRIESLRKEEEAALQALLDADRERAELDAEMAQLELEEKMLEEEEAEFWRAHNAVMLAQSDEKAKLDSLRAAYAADSAALDRLENTNVYNDAFNIGQDGPVFGTINGLRFGRTGTVDGHPVTVDYPEINAAWGQVVLLLQVLARKLEFTFERWKLLPIGSFSRIESINHDAQYELYDSGDPALVQILHRRRFNAGMVGFLDCLKQLMDHVKKEDPTVVFPEYCTIVNDKIGEYSIKLSFGSGDETWSRALKSVLRALKSLLLYATR